MSLGEYLEEKGEYKGGEWAVRTGCPSPEEMSPIAAGGPVGQTGELWKSGLWSWGVHAGFTLGCAETGEGGLL